MERDTRRSCYERCVLNEPYVHVLWCDDIRQEVGNKPSFMGVYTNGMTVKSLPFLLPRLGIWIWAAVPLNTPFESLSARVERDDGVVLLDLTPEPEAIAKVRVPPAAPEATRGSSMFGITLGPMELPAGCRFLAATVRINGKPVEGPKLWITVADQDGGGSTEAASDPNVA